jgi:hypothetical protein
MIRELAPYLVVSLVISGVAGALYGAAVIGVPTLYARCWSPASSASSATCAGTYATTADKPYRPTRCYRRLGEGC